MNWHEILKIDQMKAKLTRRRFLQAAAVTTTAAFIPGVGIADTAMYSKPADETEKIPLRRLGRTNRMVSCIGFGSGSRYCNWVADDDILQKHIDHAVNLGITYFDSARIYGNGVSEQRYGKFLVPKYRKQIFLNSKSMERTYDGVMKDIETSLKTLNTDYLDMYTIHGIDQMEDVDTLLGSSGGYKAFLKLRDQGVAKSLCFSYHKWNEASQRCFKEFDVDVVMCVINAARFNGNEDNLIPQALKRDLGIVAIKIMGQNALIGNVTGDELLRYALTLPFSVANIGMDGFAPLESCAEVAREPLISSAEAEKIRAKLNFDPKVTKLPYFIG